MITLTVYTGPEGLQNHPQYHTIIPYTTQLVLLYDHNGLLPFRLPLHIWSSTKITVILFSAKAASNSKHIHLLYSSNTPVDL